jgi:hypothetical protein
LLQRVVGHQATQPREVLSELAAAGLEGGHVGRRGRQGVAAGTDRHGLAGLLRIGNGQQNLVSVLRPAAGDFLALQGTQGHHAGQQEQAQQRNDRQQDFFLTRKPGQPSIL